VRRESSGHRRQLDHVATNLADERSRESSVVLGEVGRDVVEVVAVVPPGGNSDGLEGR
jgi:hypothetical protein